jgi:NADPH:quinone reductase-like Zn-dependent oxidoreductase
VEPLTGLLEHGDIRPVVAKTFALEDGPAAHRYLHERRNVGKVVLEL